MNRGAQTLKSLGLTAKTIATAAASGKTSPVYSWLSGRRTPGTEARRKLQDLYGIAPTAWDEPIVDEPIVPAPVPIEAATPEAVTGEAERVLAMVRQAREEVSRDPTLDPAGRTRALANITQMMTSLGKLTAGVGVSERQILDSPRWRPIKDAIARALEPWPDAMRAVATELRSLRGETPDAETE